MRAAAVFGVVVVSGMRTTAAAPCPPRAVISGDDAAVARVRDELGRIGVATGEGDRPAGTGGSTCRSVSARVVIGDRGGIAVAVVDASGRSEGRVVSDAALAAAWIDSWLHDELPADALGGEARAAPVVSARGEPPAAAWLERGSLIVSYDTTWAGSTWQGVTVDGCVKVAGVCVGARASYAHQAAGGANGDRATMIALATASTAFALGRMTIAPELGAGVGRFAETGLTVCPVANPASCPSGDPACVPSTPCTDPSGMVSAAVIEPRAAAALHVSVPLFSHVWLDASASALYVIAAHTQTFTVGGGSLPGEPATSVAVGVGVRVGTP